MGEVVRERGGGGGGGDVIDWRFEAKANVFWSTLRLRGAVGGGAGVSFSGVGVDLLVLEDLFGAGGALRGFDADEEASTEALGGRGGAVEGRVIRPLPVRLESKEK